MKKINYLTLTYSTGWTCPECGGKNTVSVDRGDTCNDCGYNVYYP